MDVVEVSPPYGHAEMTSNAAAMIAVEMLCLKAWARGARPVDMDQGGQPARLAFLPVSGARQGLAGLNMAFPRMGPPPQHGLAAA